MNKELILLKSNLTKLNSLNIEEKLFIYIDILNRI